MKKLILIAAVCAHAAAAPAAAQGLEPGDRFHPCGGCPEMIVVPAGSFSMGSPPGETGRYRDEGPVHTVTIKRPFAVGVYEVTFDEWDYCVKQGGCSHRPGDSGWGRGSRPVINVNWEDAQTYVGWLSHVTGMHFRLLTEAEWEYAARAGTRTPFHFGRTITTHQANYDGRHAYGSGRRGIHRGQTLPVGSFPANSFGLHDVHGNVWEWTEDCWHFGYEGAPAYGSAWLGDNEGDCSERVLRGGSWSNVPRYLRSADRYRRSPDYRNIGNGFRVAMTLAP